MGRAPGRDQSSCPCVSKVSRRCSTNRLSLREPAVRSGWILSVCPAAGEAGGCFVPKRRRSSARWGVRTLNAPGRRRLDVLGAGCAGTALRTGLNRLGTLTYAPPFCTDPGEVRRHAGRVLPEPADARSAASRCRTCGCRSSTPTGRGSTCTSRWVATSSAALIDEAWGHGIVHIKLLGDLPVGLGALAEARHAAGYLSKYVGKSFEDARDPASAPLRRRAGVPAGTGPGVGPLGG